MGPSWKFLFVTPVTTTQNEDKITQGYSYDESQPLSPPIRGKHPFLGNGPIRFGQKVIQASGPRRRGVKNQLDIKIRSTVITSMETSSDVCPTLYTDESSSTLSTVPSNLKTKRLRRSSEKDMRLSRPVTSISSTSETPQRPRTGYLPKSLWQDVFRTESMPPRKPSKSLHHQIYSVDLLDAHSIINSSKELSEVREQASGKRDYGEDVADRNIPLELPILRSDSHQETRLPADTPEPKCQKTIHQTSKKAISMIDANPCRESPNPGRRTSSLSKQHAEDTSHPHSHLLRSILTSKTDTPRPTTASAQLDRYQLRSLSESSPYTHDLTSECNLWSTQEDLTNNLNLLPSQTNSPSKTQFYSLTQMPREKSDVNNILSSRRHTISASSAGAAQSSKDQASSSVLRSLPLHEARNRTSFIIRTKLKPKEIFIGKVAKNLSHSSLKSRASDTLVMSDIHHLEKFQSATQVDEIHVNHPKKEGFLVNRELTQRDAIKQRSPQLDSEVTPAEEQLTSRSNEELKSETDGKSPINREINAGKTNSLFSRPTSRRDLTQESPGFVTAEIPAIPFYRRQSACHSEEFSRTNTQQDSNLVDNEPADAPIIATASEKSMRGKPKKASLRLMSSLISIRKEKTSLILPKIDKHLTKKPTHETQYAWNHSKMTENENDYSQAVYGHRSLVGIRPPSPLSYCYSSDNDEFSCSQRKSLGPDGEELLFRDDNFGSNFGGMLPGLWAMNPISGSRTLVTACKNESDAVTPPLT